MKSHITKQHKSKTSQKSPEGGDAVLEDDIEADMRKMAEWDRPTEPSTTEETINENENDATKEVLVLDLVKKLETELETAKDAASIAVAESASLEDEKVTLKSQLNFFRRVGNAQVEDIKKMRAGGPNPELERKMKEAENQVKTKTKTIEALEKSKTDLIKKVEEETSARAKAEADCAKFSKMVDILQQCPGNQKDIQEKPRIKCRDVSKPGGCPRAGSCTFYHPELARENKNVDCHHWMSGRCKFSEKNCKYKHDPTKKDSKAAKRKRSEESEPPKETAQQQDFLIGLVKALAQSSAGEARMGRQEEASRGLEGHRDTRPRMVSPNNSARGLDGQQWNNRSYANVSSNTWGRGDQEMSRSSHRQDSPPRGLESQEPMEHLRGMAQNSKPASQMDQMQEAVKLLMQISAQQGGRR